MLGDEAREGGLVTLGGEADRRGQNRDLSHGDVRHVR
jgi:hypothetical protein